MHQKLPKVIVSSVIRSSQKGESHGGIYILDLETEESVQVFDWNDASISWEGRGGDRGLRGIAIYKDRIFLAASDELFCFDRDFTILASYKNPYLKHTHEICVKDDRLYLTSTGFDSVLIFDLKEEKFIEGFCFRLKKRTLKFKIVNKLFEELGLPFPLQLKYRYFSFNPNEANGPKSGDTVHLNNVTKLADSIGFSGKNLGQFVQFKNGTFKSVAAIPIGTHNVQEYQNGLLYNETKADRITWINNQKAHCFSIEKYQETDLENSNVPKDHARQAFGRGLCTFQNLIIGGSSPATISVYDQQQSKLIKRINLSKDIRNAIHGLEIWPF